jgi:dihydrofolate reductase
MALPLPGCRSFAAAFAGRAVGASTRRNTTARRAMTTSDPPSPALAIIAAVARNGVIGMQGALPWRIPEDLKRFRALTTGHAIIMGRRTWDSLGCALPQRQNIVVTRHSALRAEGAEIAASLDDALARVALARPAFCIGGGELYALALPRADVLHLTEIDRDFTGDAYFPAWPHRAWTEVARETRRTDEGLDYAFVTYARAAATGAQPRANAA